MRVLKGKNKYSNKEEKWEQPRKSMILLACGSPFFEMAIPKHCKNKIK